MCFQDLKKFFFPDSLFHTCYMPELLQAQGNRRGLEFTFRFGVGGGVLAKRRRNRLCQVVLRTRKKHKVLKQNPLGDSCP